MLLTRDREPLA